MLPFISMLVAMSNSSNGYKLFARTSLSRIREVLVDSLHILRPERNHDDLTEMVANMYATLEQLQHKRMKELA